MCKKSTNENIKGYRNLVKRYFLAMMIQGWQFKMKEAFNLYFEIFQSPELELNEVWKD